MKPKTLAAAIDVGISGHYRMQTWVDDGYIDANSGLWVPGKKIITRKLGWWDNIITNQGLDYIGQVNSFLNYCHVGSGTTAEAATDTVLVTFAASKLASTDPSKSFDATRGTAPYYAYARRNYRFNPGEATGNLTEAGISIQAATGGLFSRALIKDGGGSPTTITKLANEYLDVDYEWRVYPAYVSADLDSSVSGEGFILRAANVTTNSNFGALIVRPAGYGTVASQALRAYNKDAVIGAVTAAPGSATATDDVFYTNATDATYTPGNHYQDITYNFGLDDAVFNVGGSDGIKALMFYTSMGAYQMVFDDLQAKTAEDVAALVIRLSWARATIP